MPDATVVIPTYNRPEHLTGALRSLAAQFETEFPFSVIVVDDGSLPPVSLSTVDFPYDLRLIRLDQNSGRAAARNAGLRAVKGGLVIFLDDDIRAQAGFVRAYCESLEPDSAVVGLGAVQFHPDVPRDALTRYLESRGIAKLAPHAPIPFKYFLTYNSAAPARMLMDAGAFDERLQAWGGEDIELAWRLQKRGATFVRVPGARALHAHRRTIREVCRVSEIFGRESMPILFEMHPEMISHLKADVLGPREFSAEASMRRLVVRVLTNAAFARPLRTLVGALPRVPWHASVFDYLIASAWRAGLDDAVRLR